jgi:hypothetical protein
VEDEWKVSQKVNTREGWKQKHRHRLHESSGSDVFERRKVVISQPWKIHKE